MSYQNIKLEMEDHVALLTICRPKALNALNTQTLMELRQAIQQVVEDEQTYVLVITGEGEKAFVAGADITEMLNLSPEEARRFSELGQAVFQQIEQLEKPVIAAINGYALGGGCELALACDIRLAADTARLGQPEVGLGITPGFGGTQRLPRLVGAAKAKELILTGEMIAAEEALRIGLVNRVYAAEELMARAMEMARTIASKSQLAVRYAKQAIIQGLEASISTALQLEAGAFALCFAHGDQREGMEAFLEKRKPKFTSK